MNSEKIIHIAELAGKAILEIYNRSEELKVEKKDNHFCLSISGSTKNIYNVKIYKNSK